MANQSPNSSNINRHGNDLSFRCADMGHKECKWQTSGRSEDEVLRNVEQHGREKHGIQMNDDLRNKARGVIRGSEQRAA